MADSKLVDGVDRSELRKEALLFPWDHLTRDQKIAILDAHRRFTMLAQYPYDPKPQPKLAERNSVEKFLPSLEREKTAVNRVVLIDGGRGSGKTVVLMRLLQFWSDELRETPTHDNEEEFIAAIAATETRDRTAEAAKSSCAPRQKPDSTSHPIVPIGFVQLSLLDESANLLTYLSGFLHQAIAAIVDARSARTRSGLSPWTAVEDSGTHLSQAWNQFLQAIAHASSDQSLERRKILDPEAWALELRDAEFRRRDISDYFSDLMDMLVNEFASKFLSRGQLPMFVIAVDDADLRPQHSVRLLNVIRQLNHPRVGFIMTGETPLFVRMLTDSLLGRLRTPLRALDLDDKESQEQREDRRFASRLARDIYDKVVPRSHRYDLPALDESERVTLAVRENKQLAQLTFKTEALPRLIRPPATKRRSDFTEKRTLLDYFTASPALRGALPPRLREMASFREYLNTQERSVIDVVDWLWQRAVEHSELEPHDQTRLGRVIRKKRGQNRLSIETYAFKSEFLPRVILPQRRIRDRWSVVVRDIDSYELTFDGEHLSERVTAAFMLASDVTADALHADFLGRSVSPNEFRVPFVTISYSARDYRSYDFVWPLPDWDGFTDFEIFSARWRKVLSEANIISEESKGDAFEWTSQSTQRMIGMIARLFLGVAIDVADHRAEAAIPEPERSWEHLAQQLQALSHAGEKRGTYRRNQHIVEWARTRAPLLAAPESGLAAEDANEFLRALENAHVIDADAAVRARESRAIVAVRKKIEPAFNDEETEQLIRKTVDGLLDEIDGHTRSRKYNWRNLQKSKEPVSRTSIEVPAPE